MFDQVLVDGLLVKPYDRHKHVMLHKPSGCLSSRGEKRRQPDGSVILDSRPVVYDFLDKESQSRHCVAVGRLDEDTTGLLLFTTNGSLLQKLVEP
jgi:16S rRNA U516 pseudouridylate synthase RsuA-like enzyme